MSATTSLRTIKASSSLLRNLSHAAPYRSFSTAGPRFVGTSIPRAANMTTSTFKYIDPSSYVQSDVPFVKPWGKVDGPGYSFKLTDREQTVENIRGREREDNISTAGFAVYKSPAKEKAFTDDAKVREEYYPEVEALIR